MVFNDEPYRRLACTQLARVAGFEELAPEMIESLAAEGSLQRVREGELIEVHNQAPRGLQVIVDGVVALGPDLSRTPGELLVFLGAGDVFNFSAVTDGGPCVWDARTRTPCVLLTIPRAAVMAAPKALQHACAVQIAHLNRVLCDRLSDALYLPLSARLARQIAVLMNRFGVPRGEASLIDLRISQEELASMLGSSRQQVNVELKRLEQLGTISLRRESITVLDPAGMMNGGYGTRPITLRRSDSPG